MSKSYKFRDAHGPEDYMVVERDNDCISFEVNESDRATECTVNLCKNSVKKLIQALQDLNV